MLFVLVPLQLVEVCRLNLLEEVGVLRPVLLPAVEGELQVCSSPLGSLHLVQRLSVMITTRNTEIVCLFDC